MSASSEDARATTEQRQRARTLVLQALEIVGDDEFASVCADLANEQLQTAVARLRSSSWWARTLQQSVVQPTLYNTTLLCKILDKAIPTPQSIKLGAEEGFKLIIEGSVKS